MKKSNLTRRAFLSMALGATSLALTPKDALAEERVCETPSAGAQEAMRLWEKACSEAKAAGEPIICVDYPEKQRQDSEGVVVTASDRRVTGVTSGTFTTVAGQPEVIKAVAVYWVGSGGVHRCRRGRVDLGNVHQGCALFIFVYKARRWPNPCCELYRNLDQLYKL